MSPASKQYEVSQVYSRGTGSAAVRINVPMCASHFEAASANNSAEKLVAALGVIFGILAGIAALVILIMRWVPTGNDSFILKLFISSIVGFGVFIMVWASVALCWRQCLPIESPKRRAGPSESYWSRHTQRSYDWNL